MIWFISGGSASGKSAYAEAKIDAWAERERVEDGKRKIYYLATMENRGEEAKERIEKHRKARSMRAFQTIECPRNLKQVFSQIEEGSFVLLECLSNLVANEMFQGEAFFPEVSTKIEAELVELEARCKGLVIVSNEIFSDGIPYDSWTTQYIKELGILNQFLAKRAFQVTELVYGIPIQQKGNFIES